MKINPVTAYGKIQVERPMSAARVPGREPPSEINTDQVSFGAGKEIGRIVQAVLRESAQPEPAERIASLRAAVAENAYFVPSGRLADAILDRAFGGM